MESPSMTLIMGLIGPGLVGQELLQIISETSNNQDLLRQRDAAIQVHAISNSKQMMLSGSAASPQGLDLDTWTNTPKLACDLDVMIHHLKEVSQSQEKRNISTRLVLCDCTSSDAIAKQYAKWLRSGINVVAANKKANSGTYQDYLSIKSAESPSARFFYEANVGAGLPIMTTIKDLLLTGDQFIEIQGVFSGTMSYIFNEFDGSVAFSDIVTKAKDAGYTEPDPRDDLSGMDVARKVVILAREIGIRVELADVPVKSLVPKALEKVSVDEFMKRLPEFDHELEAMASDAAKNNEKLRYAGVINTQTNQCTVELRKYPSVHPFGGLKGSDNIILFRTARYNSQPLTIRGPGAGASVTAMGVLADILRVANVRGKSLNNL